MALAYCWGLIDGEVKRGEALASEQGMRAVAGSGWCPLAASATSGSGGDDDEGETGPDEGAVPSPAAAVAALSRGYGHELRLTVDGRVWTRCLEGSGPGRWSAVAGLLEAAAAAAAAASVRFVQVAAGERHSLALTADGRVFQWGVPQSGSCGGGGGSGGSDDDNAAAGLKTFRCICGPGTPDEPEPVAQIAAGGRHSLAVTARTGTVLVWGSNLQGQAGADRGEAPVDVPSPRRVAPLVGVPVACVAAGAHHSAAVSRDGSAYAWGCGVDGALGNGRGDGAGGGGSGSGSGSDCGDAGLGVSSATPLLMESASPSSQSSPTGLDDEEVLSVACGRRHTVLLCRSGRVYACGWNRYGQSCCCCSSRSSPSSLGSSGIGSGSGSGVPGEGLDSRWRGGCPHGAAVYRPRLVKLPPLEGGGARRATEVFAGAWWTVVRCASASDEDAPRFFHAAATTNTL